MYAKYNLIIIGLDLMNGINYADGINGGGAVDGSGDAVAMRRRRVPSWKMSF